MRSIVIVLALASLSSSLSAQLARPESVQDDRFLIQVRTLPPLPVDPHSNVLMSTGDASLDRLLDDVGAVEIARVFRRPLRGWRSEVSAQALGLERWLRVRLETESPQIESLVARFAQHPSVEVAEIEVTGSVADTVPDDPDFSNQYSLQNGKLNAPKAWDIATSSTHVVAVIDTGADLDHQDLVSNLWSNPGEIPGNLIDDDLNGYVDDVVGWDFAYDDADPNDQYGHGIHTSGTVGAATNNTRQVAGVCWTVPIMEVQVFDRFGSAPIGQAAAGLVYAADNGASVESNSWGYSTPAKVLEDAVKYALSLDVVIVAAAHNFSSQSKMYPAAYPGVMGIIATDKADKKAGFSNYGSWCDMAAPGVDVLSLYLNNGTAELSGTSMSTPHVAGAAALVREVNPSLDGVDTLWVLNYSSLDLGTAGFDIHFGWGRLDLLAALERARSLTISQNVAKLGDTVTLELSQPSEPDYVHVLLASRFGREPGTALSLLDAADHRQLPLNADPFLFMFIFGSGGGGVFNGFVGNLDATGHGTAKFTIPREPLLLNTSLDFAYLTFVPGDLGHVSSVSTSVHLAIQ